MAKIGFAGWIRTLRVVLSSPIRIRLKSSYWLQSALKFGDVEGKEFP